MQAACSTISMAMCSLMLMSVIKTGRSIISEEEESHFLTACLLFARTYATSLLRWAQPSLKHALTAQ